MKNVQKIDLGLTGYDELFANDEERKVNKLPRIFDIPISEIDDFPDHPFKVKIDEDMVIAEQNWQPMIDAIWENRTVEDYESTGSTVKTDFMRKWHHNRSGKSISLDEMMENEDGDIFEVADPRGEFEQKVISEMQIAAFAEQSITEKDREILKLRMEGYTEQEIADKVGYKTASAVHKRIAKIAGAYEDYVTAEYQKFLDK